MVTIENLIVVFVFGSRPIIIYKIIIIIKNLPFSVPLPINSTLTSTAQYVVYT